jgi:hypothetical protein
MAETMLEKMQGVDLGILTEVVRKDQDSPSFEIGEWSVKQLSDQGAVNTDGLWLFSGKGSDDKGSRLWSVVLKTPHAGDGNDQVPITDIWYWKRETLLAQSGLTSCLPGPVRAPRFYRTDEYSDSAWLWMEHIKDEHPKKWSLKEFSFAAHQLGAWNGKYVTGTPLPNYPWLTRELYRSWQNGIDPEKDWQFPLHQKHITQKDQTRWERLWSEREDFFAVAEAQPQVFSHFDANRRNMLISKAGNGNNELVLIDWSMCGIGPLGADLSTLTNQSMLFLEWSPANWDQLETAAFAGYIQGLREVGWKGDVQAVRLSFVTWNAIFLGTKLPNLLTWLSSDERETIEFVQKIVGVAGEELYVTLLPLMKHCWDCADEARQLMKKL